MDGLTRRKRRGQVSIKDADVIGSHAGGVHIPKPDRLVEALEQPRPRPCRTIPWTKILHTPPVNEVHIVEAVEMDIGECASKDRIDFGPAVHVSGGCASARAGGLRDGIE